MRLMRACAWWCSVVLWALTGYGCAHAPPLTTQPSICFADPEPVPGSCGALYDAQGRACVVCVQDRACVDADTDTYCVGAAACQDSACGPRK